MNGAYGSDLHSLYFNYFPAAGHLHTCSRHGSDVWEVTRYSRDNFDGDRIQTVLRLVCSECGVVHFERTDGETSTETTHAGHMGIGSRPVRDAGLWLWAGPIIYYGDNRGPTSFLVTTAKTQPRKPDDVVGIVGWWIGERGGMRWNAGIGCTAYGTERAAERSFTTRRGAVKWIAGELAHVAGDQ